MRFRQKNNKDILTLNEFISKPVRDLLYLIYSENLEHPNISQDICFHTNNDLTLENKILGLSLETTVNNKRMTLGKYAENLLLLYFQKNQRYGVYGNNLQLIDGKTTIGEVDYLIHDLDQDMAIHLEFAIKYYLKYDNGNTTIFIGPNAKDKMHLKVEKLLSHQTKLLNHFAHLLPNHLNQITFTPKILLKGALFYPFDEWSNSTKSTLNKGWWLALDNLNQLKVNCSFFYLIDNKQDWIYPFYNQTLLSFSTTKIALEKLLQVKSACMVVRLNEKKEPIDRGFIVSNEWPNQH